MPVYNFTRRADRLAFALELQDQHWRNLWLKKFKADYGEHVEAELLADWKEWHVRRQA